MDPKGRTHSSSRSWSGDSVATLAQLRLARAQASSVMATRKKTCPGDAMNVTLDVSKTKNKEQTEPDEE